MEEGRRENYRDLDRDHGRDQKWNMDSQDEQDVIASGAY